MSTNKEQIENCKRVMAEAINDVCDELMIFRSDTEFTKNLVDCVGTPFEALHYGKPISTFSDDVIRGVAKSFLREHFKTDAQRELEVMREVNKVISEARKEKAERDYEYKKCVGMIVFSVCMIAWWCL